MLKLDSQLQCGLVVGIGQTKDSTWSLPETAYDAIDFQHTFLGGENREERSHLVINEGATKKSIASSFRWLSKIAGTNRSLVAIVYYSGHGVRVRYAGESRYFLLTHDSQFPYDGDWHRYNEDLQLRASASEKDIAALEETSISAEELWAFIEGIAATNVVVMLDCCRANSFAKSSVILENSYEEHISTVPGRVLFKLQELKGCAVISSSANAQRSWILDGHRNSVFTECLLESSKQSTLYRRGHLGILALFPYVAAETRRRVQASLNILQQPLFTANSLSQDIIILSRQPEQEKPKPMQNVLVFRIQQAELLYANLEMRLVALDRDIETRILEVDRAVLMKQRENLFDELAKIAQEIENLRKLMVNEPPN